MFCPFCLETNIKTLYQSKKGGVDLDYLCTPINENNFGTIVQCKECGLVFRHPREDEILINRMYENFVDKDYLKGKRERSKTFAKNLKRCEKYKQPGKLLDVGCLYGLFLEEAQKRGITLALGVGD